MITTEKLKKLQPYLNMKALAIMAGIEPQALYAKLNRDSELRTSEVEKIEAALATMFLPAGYKIVEVKNESH